MIIQVRCKSCGKPIAHLHEEYKKRIVKEAPDKVFSDLGMKRFCCRAMFMGHADLIATAAQFKKP
ncbi:MAG: DNA-directed RNA polymerase subunit N [Candidatus Woesearchaeota archaeon]